VTQIGRVCLSACIAGNRSGAAYAAVGTPLESAKIVRYDATRDEVVYRLSWE
jgi:hypothetical protein